MNVDPNENEDQEDCPIEVYKNVSVRPRKRMTRRL